MAKTKRQDKPFRLTSIGFPAPELAGAILPLILGPRTAEPRAQAERTKQARRRPHAMSFEVASATRGLVVAGISILGATSCTRQTEVEYANYSECLSGEVRSNQDHRTAQEIIDSCRARFPSVSFNLGEVDQPEAVDYAAAAQAQADAAQAAADAAAAAAEAGG